jgi:dTDP-4-amino-4,6-dideoxygalactose transaminase
VQIPSSTPGADHAWGLYSILLPQGVDRAAVQEVLKGHGVPSGIYYPKPLHHQPAYAGAHAASIAAGPPALPVSEMLCGRILSLPMHPYLTEEEVARVVAAVRAAL